MSNMDIYAETERLILRAWRKEDLSVFVAMNSDPRVMEFMPATMSSAETEALLARIQAHFDMHGYGLFALERKDTGAFIGYTGLLKVPFDAPFTPAVEIGWRLAYEAWGQGFATEAAQGALKYGFLEQNLPEIVSFTIRSNERSWRVMEKLGLARDKNGDFMHPRLAADHPFAPHILYRISAEDYRRKYAA